jgi:hypothetical protein
VYHLGLTSILLAQMLVNILRENPDQSLKDVLLRIRYVPSISESLK